MRTKQTFLDTTSSENRNVLDTSTLTILNWNIQNPSEKRAQNQIEWMLEKKPNIILLTEAKESKGCFYIIDKLENSGYSTYLPTKIGGDYCVIMAWTGFEGTIKKINMDFLPHRIQCLSCETSLGNINVVGMYVPSRGPQERRNVDKRKFQHEVSKLFHNLYTKNEAHRYVVCGDLNVVERNHIPHYSVFGEWEYTFYESFIDNGLIDIFTFLYPEHQEHSWFGRKGDGYRFDHFFIEKELLLYVENCWYDHEPRLDKMSDHSAMMITLKPNRSRMNKTICNGV